MNRLEMARRVLLLEAAAAECRARAARVRAELDEAARKELAEHGSAPTWRWQDIGTMTLPVSKETAYVADDAALLAWVKVRRPSEVETLERVRPAFLAALLDAVDSHEGRVFLATDGEIIPGLGMRPGGIPQSLSFRPHHDAKAVAAAAAGQFVDELAAGLGIEAVPDET